MNRSRTTTVFDYQSWHPVLRACPPDVQTRLQSLQSSVLERIEELRFRVGQPLQVCGCEINQFLHKDTGLTSSTADALVITEAHVQRVMQSVTQASLYAVEDELRRGFVTMPGGHRVGVGGRAVLYESGSVRTLRNLTSANIRIAKEYVGASEPLFPYVCEKQSGRPYNVLIISPPQCGKTTILRDLARAWSEGDPYPRTTGRKVTIVDERSEIAGSVDGLPQFRVGPRTDVLDACPKAEGMLMAIRSLSPDVIVTDEIGRIQDRDAILEATHAGVAVVATAHSHNLDDLKSRPAMRELFEVRAFDRFVILSRRRGPGTIERVLDSEGRSLVPQRMDDR